MMKRTGIQCMLMLLFFLGWQYSVNAQVVAPGVVAYEPEGVLVDTQGVVHIRKVTDASRLRELKKRAKAKVSDQKMAYISLPGMIKEAEELIKAGKALPDRIKYMDGMVQIRYLILYPDQNDIVLAGYRETLDMTNKQRPLGMKTGRPVLQFQDMVMMFRHAGPGGINRPFGCKIDLLPDAVQRMIEAYNANDHLIGKRGGIDKVKAAMAEAGGMQPVGFYALEGTSRVAHVCVEADYVMKRLAFGLQKSPIRQVTSFVRLLRSVTTRQNRFWFELNPRAIKQTPDGTVFEFVESPIKLATHPQALPGHNTVKPSPEAKLFVERASKHMRDLERHLPSFADLSNIADMAMIAALIQDENMAKKIDWDLNWLMNKAPVQRFHKAKDAPTLVNHYTSGRAVNFVSGGVLLIPSQVISNREEVQASEMKVNTRYQHQSDWSAVEAVKK